MSALSGSSTSKPYVIEVLSEQDGPRCVYVMRKAESRLGLFDFDGPRIHVASGASATEFHDWFLHRGYPIDSDWSLVELTNDEAMEFRIRWWRG